MEDFDNSHLDNILLDKEKNRLDKIKKIILLIASLALVFTISIVIMKVLNTEEQTSDITKILPPEPIAQKEIKEPEPLFEQLPISEEPKVEDSFDKIVKDIKSKAQEDMKLAENQIESEVKKVKENKDLTTADVMSQENVVKQQPISEGGIKVEETALAKPEKPVATPVPTLKPAVKSTNVMTIESGYYIQIGAFKNVQDNFLKSLESKGFTYKLQVSAKDDGTSITKVLIGPYSDKAKANEDLLKVKESIAKGAYLTKV